MALVYPDAFFESLPADYDGLFHWEYINDVLRPRRGIQLSDIDAACEIGGDIKRGIAGNIITFETSNNVHKETVGHRRMIDSLLCTGRVAHIDIVGKKIPTQWRVRSPYAERDWCCDLDGRNAIADIVGKWAEWADNPVNRASRDYTALIQTWRCAADAARQRFIIKLAQSLDLPRALGPFADTPLGRATIERFKLGLIE